MKLIDGSFGEGGGQIFRSSLSLSMCTGTPVRIENIRAGRKKPGLLRQHLACLRASKEICNAQVKGDELGSKAVEFIPGEIKAGEYAFAIGTAGSTSLVFQTILPALLRADVPSKVQLEGGTHNQSAPSFEFIDNCFLRALKRININVEASLQQYGFYPNGGGKWTAEVTPANTVYPLKLMERGKLEESKALAYLAKLPAHIAERELHYVKKKLGWFDKDLRHREVSSFGPGNLLSLQFGFKRVSEVFDAVGAVGLTAERVAGRAVKDAKRFLDSEAAVGEHLCDQLLLPMAVNSGGSFRTLKPSLHTETNIEVIKSFLSCDITVEKLGEDLYELRVVV